MNPLICNAINEQHLLQLWWEGGARIVQPHAYGINTKGNEMLRCWQVSGYSRRDGNKKWKPILVDHAHSFEILDDTFETHFEYRMNDKHMIQIFAQIVL